MEIAYQTWLLRNHLNDTKVRKEAFEAGWKYATEGEQPEGAIESGICPVCGRVVVLNEDGTLWYHFASFMNQEDPTVCSGSQKKPRKEGSKN